MLQTKQLILMKKELPADLIIEGTNLLPTVIFTRIGLLKMEGRIISANIAPFFEPILEWINELDCPLVSFDINIDHMNSNASRKLFQLLEALENNPHVMHIQVSWSYEEDDEEYFEIGKLYAEKLPMIKFHYIGHAELI
jgi:hypothetical protein